MLAHFIRKWFGSIRFFLALLGFISGLTVVAIDQIAGKHGSAQLYAFLGTLVTGGMTFMWADTRRQAAPPSPTKRNEPEDSKPGEP